MLSLSTLLDRETYQGTDTRADSAKHQRAGKAIGPQVPSLTVTVCRLQCSSHSAGNGADGGRPI